MTFTSWKGRVLSNSHLGPLAFVTPLPSPVFNWLGIGASVNMIETPRMCGYGVTAFVEDRPVFQQREGIHTSPQVTVGIHIGVIQSYQLFLRKCCSNAS